MAFALSPAFFGFVLAATITPGPNNIMMMASGANFGLRRSLPQLLGVTLGVLAVVLLAGFGLAALLAAAPALGPVLSALSLAYLLWLAWRIVRAAAPGEGSVTRPLGMGQAAAFQLANPKIWATGFSAATLFAADGAVLSLGLVAALFTLFGFLSNALWAALGVALRRWLAEGARLRIFNLAMAALLLLSLLPLLLER